MFLNGGEPIHTIVVCEALIVGCDEAGRLDKAQLPQGDQSDVPIQEHMLTRLLIGRRD
ncbi:hypothetical protein CBM2600_A10154 [Cupriavidus taiwanensis]|nr:hypothetical protein CBM2600_A10154 [Cupriavidus taiwanensis]